MARGHSAGHVDQPRRRPRGPHARTIPHPGRRPPRRSGTASDRGRLTGTRRGAGGVNDVGWGDERPAAYCPSRFTLSLAARRPTVLLIHQDKLPSNEGFAMKIANQVFCLLAVGLLPGLAWAEQAKPSEPPENPPPIRIVVVGDSTVASYGRKADGRLPIAGWGQLLGEAFCDAVSVSNHAAGGRSSSSFVWEGRWAKAIAEKPDYVLIQFGHNDCPGKGIRYNDPATTYRDYLRRYVRYSRAAGAKPVLVTPMARRTFDDRGKITNVPGAVCRGDARGGRGRRVPRDRSARRVGRAIQPPGRRGKRRLEQQTGRPDALLGKGRADPRGTHHGATDRGRADVAGLCEEWRRRRLKPGRGSRDRHCRS